MTLYETLSAVVEHEADKLRKLSLASPERLGEADLEALETLSRCAKVLRGTTPAGEDEVPSGTTRAQDLALAGAA